MSDPRHRAFLALGSNIDAERNLPAAVRLLARFGNVRAVSSVYQTAPLGFADQLDFLNAAVLLETTATLADLRERIVPEIETALHRVRVPGNRNAPRTIDIDIALFDREIVRDGSFRIPDPDILTRPFLAIPLAELDPEYLHPQEGRPLADIAATFQTSDFALRVRNDVELAVSRMLPQ